MLKKSTASTEEPTSVFQRIIDILKQRNIPRKKLAERLNIHPKTLNEKLKGNSPFILNECFKICSFLDVDYEEVFDQHITSLSNPFLQPLSSKGVNTIK